MSNETKKKKSKTVNVFTVIKAKMSEYKQLFGKRYEQVERLLRFDRDSDYFVDVEEKETKGGRKFHVVNFVNPDDETDVLSLPISGDHTAEVFEIWDCTNIDDWSTDDGKLIPKGLKKIRCYSAEEDED